VIEHLFMEKMVGMEVTSLTRAGFQLFDNSFLIVNLRAGKIKKTNTRAVENQPIGTPGTPTMGTVAPVRSNSAANLQAQGTMQDSFVLMADKYLEPTSCGPSL